MLATDQVPSLSHDKIPTEVIAEALYVDPDHIAIDALDETKDNENSKSREKGEGEGNIGGNESKNMGDEEGEKCGGGVDGSVIVLSHSQPHSQESQQNHHNVETAGEEAATNSQPLTRKLLESGGDIRALLLSSQPLSSFRAKTSDTGNGNEGAGQKLIIKNEEEEVEEEQQERFVRPRRLRLKESKKAASDGFPSAIALSLRWHPDHMQDLPGDAANLSIRAAFDTKFDEYYVFRHWRPSLGSLLPHNISSQYSLPNYYLYHSHPSQGMPPIHDVRLRWRSVMLLIASHLDSKVPLTRVVCWALDQLPSAALPTSAMVTTSTDSNEEVSSPSESLQKDASIESGQIHHHHRYHQREVVMDIEAIKWCHPEQPSGPGKEHELVEMESCEQQRKLQPVIFVRYAVTDSAQENNLVDSEAIDRSAKELSDEGISQRRISCSMDEIQHLESLLQEQEACVDEAYRSTWKEKSSLNGTVFRLSLLRPTLEPLFPHRTAKLERRAERQAREVKRIEQLVRQQRRIERMLELELEEQLRKDELQMRRDKGEIVDRVCSKPGCEEWALLQCPRCPNACYCRIERKSIYFLRSSVSLY